MILERRDGHLAAIVEDDGRGFDYDRYDKVDYDRDDRVEARTNAERHLGLPGMRERIEAIGGSFLVETAPGKGTSLFIRVPLADGEGQA